MKSVFALTLLITGLLVTDNPAAEKTNLILLLADDLSATALSCYGGESVQTPVLDKLAAEGIRYTHCYSPALCMPSRTELLTGKYSHRNYVGRGHLAPGETNIASKLKKAGYATCQVEKWHLNINKGAMPPDVGFDEYYHTKLSHNYENPRIDINGEEVDVPGGYGPKVCQKYAFDFIARHKDQPFFLYYAIHLPHAPYHVPPGFDLGEKPSHQDKYFAMIEHMDAMVGELVDYLDSLALRERTLLVFLGDNGTPKGFRYRTNGRDLEGGKSSPLDSGTHVPMIVSWPGTAPTGVVTGNLVDFADFLPTALELAGENPRPAMKLDGRSFYRQLLGDPEAPVRDIAFKFGVKNGGKGAGPVNGYWARNQRWKLYYDGRLYDMEADPLEESP
ncbi:MAG: sulfatase-like hydrolase/transferase, partial [Verrucomicrobiota bacterium]